MTSSAEVNIHLRARSRDRDLIDRAAEAAGLNRSQFMLGASLRAAKDAMLDRTTFEAEAAAFERILDWMDAPAAPEQAEGMARLKAAPGWARE
jgi:uncharacterized protein (DUF1778 family)